MRYEDRSHGRPTWPQSTFETTSPQNPSRHARISHSCSRHSTCEGQLPIPICLSSSPPIRPGHPRPPLRASQPRCPSRAPRGHRGLRLSRSRNRLCDPLRIEDRLYGTGSRAAAYSSSCHSLVKAFIRWYTDPATRPVAARHLWVQLFARAQGQYLFPNSSDYPGKCPLSDAGLCAWWRRVMGQVGGDVREAVGVEGRVDMYYVLPGSKSWEVAFHHLLPGHNGSTDIHTAKPISHFRVPLQNRDLHGWPTLRVGQQGLSTRASRTCHTPLCIVVPVAHQLGLSIGRIRLFPWAACCL
jgi:hypothetical protein